MKEIKTIEPVYIEQYDIKVNQYLTYAQIQKIVDSVRIFDDWAGREQGIDMLVLFYATDIGKENLEKIGHDILLESGLIDAVRSNIKNLYSVYEAIEYTESIEKSLTAIVKELPKYFEPFEKVMKKYGDNINK